MNSVLDFAAAKAAGQRISMVTCYDACMASMLEASAVDCLLVGDSAAMVMHGHANTLAATVDLMAMHTAAVRRGAPTRFVVGDLPFLSYRKGVSVALDAVESIMRAGAQAVKLEGVSGHEDVVCAIVGSGVPVMGHLGLTPQSIHALAGFRVQGRSGQDAERILAEALQLEELGCFALVLECMPAALAQRISEALVIPTIGIGAGAGCDGQVLVLQDLLGLSAGFQPKFLRTYFDGFGQLRDAVNRFDDDVKRGLYPGPGESYES